MAESALDSVEPKPWTRLLVVGVFLVGGVLLVHHLTGSFIPTDPKYSLIFQGSLLLVIMGSALLEHKFTKPADSLVNALVAVITLLPVRKTDPGPLWWLVFGYCLAVLLLSIICVAVSTGPQLSRLRQRVAALSYRPAVVLGKARVVYSLLFLFGLFSFYTVQSRETLFLLLFWGMFVVVWPLRLPELLSSMRVRSQSTPAIGQVLRTDAPNIVRVQMEPSAAWTRNSRIIYQQQDGRQTLVVPLYSQVMEGGVIGTGLCVPSPIDNVSGLTPGFVYSSPHLAAISDSDIVKLLSGEPDAKLIGFIIEDSTIATVRFEILDSEHCKDEMVAWCRVGDERVFYQVTNGITREEALQSDRHGFQVATAVQLGTLDEQKGFRKFEWLPAMNTPMFSIPERFGSGFTVGQQGDFKYGSIPNTSLAVVGPLIQTLEHHTAILGVTGSGKTELAFDVIHAAVRGGVKVICIDLTSQYSDRLSALTPHDLSISGQLSDELGKKLFDVETGQYGAGTEKKVLKDFSDKLRKDVEHSLQQFLLDKSDATRLGLIQLDEISNTQATLFVTELYLTCLLRFARDHKNECPRVLLVVEEAHTVMPEPNTMGLGDFNSKALVAKIAQIALQGRKYGVGLLVVAQRTATVSKSVLTQCNTVVSFTCFDDTSLSFLTNVFGQSHTALIPSLPPLHAVVFGKGVRSERPVIVEVPFDDAKANPKPQFALAQEIMQAKATAE